MSQPSPISRSAIAGMFLRGNGIEIGALHNPLPVPSGVHVRYVDRLSKPQLYQHYPELAQHNLVDVDVIDDGEALTTFAPEGVDFVIANHFIEHCEDPIGALKAFARVLGPQGVVYLAVPDKRHTFDEARPNTPLSHLIEDHVQGPGHRRFDHYLEWVRLVEPTFGTIYPDEAAVFARAKHLEDMGYSIHFHCWTPATFLQFFGYCQTIIPLEMEFFLSTRDEMILVLRRSDVPSTA